MTGSCELVSLGNGGNVLKVDFSDGTSVICSKTLRKSSRNYGDLYT